MVRYSAAIVMLFIAASVGAADAPGTDLLLADTPVALLGEAEASYFAGVVDIEAEVEWQVHIPAGYDASRPPGLLVYVSPRDSGRIPPGWKTVMADSNLLWVAANRSGNRVDAGARMAYALMAAIAVGKRYELDHSRIFVSGFSGGGRVASVLAPQYPHIFRGAIYICGVNFWGGETPARMQEVKRNRFVFITGSKDFNRRETRRALRSYRKVGVEQVLLLDIDGMGHSNPKAGDLATAIGFLSGRESGP